MKSPEDKKVTTEDLEAPRGPGEGTEAIANARKSDSADRVRQRQASAASEPLVRR